MKKIVLALLSATTFSTFLLAGEIPKGVFVGAGGGISRQFLEDDSRDYDFGITNPFISVKGGYDFGDFRVYGQINHNFETEGNDDYEFSSTEFLVGADYYLNQISDFRLFAGAYVGHADISVSQTISYSGFSSKYDLSDTSFMAGAKFGAIYSLGDNGDLEFGTKLDHYSSSGPSSTKLSLFAEYVYKF